MASVEQLFKQASVLRRRAKALLAFTLATVAMIPFAQAQTFAEWFSQKKTQKKYLLQQIAALQVYSGYLQKGYRIAKGGLGSIGGYVGDEFGLHSGYYRYLSSVSIPVKNDPQVNAILRWQQDILKQVKQLKDQGGLTNNEMKYVSKVSSALLSDCDAQLYDLQIILADEKTTMSDEERIRQIARLHRNMENNYRFIAGFRSQLQIYARSKQQEIREINTLTHLYASH
ncbi:hypothetical protein LT679_00575 [Mucilaginibacter roseus]|uniref:TerB family tellurite resistance protein n=1 Tax=Mucilaginibacter roseus TaxID=1528868 RepID=A0ABS8TZ43_9SPHI|nr:hypothetical protein [Mucilaginibacter roseus]MCD8739080.1 hypothetical protein [Mucilaginibacter roseus]